MTHSREKINIDRDWLESRYAKDGAAAIDIANEAGCSIHTIKKWLQLWKIKRGVKTKRIAWNKGLSKQTDERLKKLSEDRKGSGNPMAGRPAWNKGLTAETNETIALMRDKNIGRVVTDETREKQRLAKLGLRGSESNNYKQGRHLVGKPGFQYWVIGDGDTKKYEHRLIAEAALCREIKKEEHVHHLNGDKLDNDPKNLLVLYRGAHIRLHKHCFPAPKEEQLAWLSSQNEWFFEVSSEN